MVKVDGHGIMWVQLTITFSLLSLPLLLHHPSTDPSQAPALPYPSHLRLKSIVHVLPARPQPVRTPRILSQAVVVATAGDEGSGGSINANTGSKKRLGGEGINGGPIEEFGGDDDGGGSSSATVPPPAKRRSIASTVTVPVTTTTSNPTSG